ncbi:MAG: RNA polymerase sigma factor [Candidatus Eiseniibacteriota bacterium]
MEGPGNIPPPRSSIVPNAGGGAGLGIPNEAELIARLRARDLEALGELYRELGDRMTTLARTMLRDADEAADVVEDALLRVQEAAPGFRGERGLTTWVMRIVANRCRDLLRRRKFAAGRPEDMDPMAESGLRAEPIEGWDLAIDQARMLVALESAIDALPAEQREAVVLRDRLGLSYDEVAETLGVKVAAVKSRLFRARAALRAALRPLGGE